MSRYDRGYDRGYDDYDRGYGGGGGQGYGYGGGGGGRGPRFDRGETTMGGGAGHLARIHGTEEDRVNCPFYFKIGACRHGDRCSRVHNKPVFSQTVIIPQMYENPLVAQDPLSQYNAFATQKGYHDQPDDEEFEDFFVDIFEELSKFGEVDEIVVCDNLCDHLVGNVYVKYFDEEDSAKCQKALNGRFYAGRQLKCEFSPVTDFREARCRQYHDNHCSRNGDCNFIHTKRVSSKLVSELQKLQKYAGKRSKPESYKKRKKSRSSSSSGGSSSSSSSDSESEKDKKKKKSKKSKRSKRARKDSKDSKRSKSPKAKEGDKGGEKGKVQEENGDGQ